MTLILSPYILPRRKCRTMHGLQAWTTHALLYMCTVIIMNILSQQNIASHRLHTIMKHTPPCVLYVNITRFTYLSYWEIIVHKWGIWCSHIGNRDEQNLCRNKNTTTDIEYHTKINLGESNTYYISSKPTFTCMQHTLLINYIPDYCRTSGSVHYQAKHCALDIFSTGDHIPKANVSHAQVHKNACTLLDLFWKLYIMFNKNAS